MIIIIIVFLVSLTVVVSCRLVSVTQLVLECVEAGLRDISALVRRTAVMATLKLFYQDQHLFFG